MTTHQHILALTLVDDQYVDGLGNQYPTEGVFRSEDYKPDDNIAAGIWGFEWGVVTVDTQVTHGIVWTVQDGAELHKLGDNIVKFKRGTVAFAGRLDECYAFLKKEEQEPSRTYSRSPEATRK